MAKPLELNTDGSFTETTPIIVSAGATSANKLAQLNSSGQFDSSLIPATGGGPSKSFVIAMAVVMG